MIFGEVVLVILGVALIALGIDLLRHNHNKVIAVCDIAIGVFDILNVITLLLD